MSFMSARQSSDERLSKYADNVSWWIAGDMESAKADGPTQSVFLQNRSPVQLTSVELILDGYIREDPVAPPGQELSEWPEYQPARAELAILWVPESRLTSPDLLVRRRRKPGMIGRWRCG